MAKHQSFFFFAAAIFSLIFKPHDPIILFNIILYLPICKKFVVSINILNTFSVFKNSLAKMLC